MGIRATEDPASAATAGGSDIYRLVAELTTDYIYSLVPSPDGGLDVEAMGDGFEDVTGYTLEELRRRGGFGVLVHPDDSAIADAALDRLREGSTVREELRLICKDGTTIWVRVFCKPVGDERGTLTRVVGTAQDITEEKAATFRLAKSREVLARAESLANVGSWEWDVAADRVEWSDELLRIFGLERDLLDPTFEGFDRCVHPEDRDLVQRTMEAAVDEGRFSFHYRIVRPSDGAERIIHCVGGVEIGADGRPARFFGSDRDVTEYMRGQHDLVHEIARSRLLVAVARIVNEVTSLEAALGLSLGTVCDLTGWDAGHVFLMEGGELVPTGVWHDDGSDLAPLKAATAAMDPAATSTLPRRVVASGRPLSITDDSDDPGFIRREAARSCGIRAVHLFPLLSIDKPVGVVEFFSRVRAEAEPEMADLMTTVGIQLGRAVERSRAATALAESEERFRSLTETARDAIISVDHTGTIRYANPAAERLFGYRAQELEGASVEVLVPERMRGRYRQGPSSLLDALRVGGSPDRIEARGRRRDGSEVAVELSLSRRRISDGYMFTAILRDISDRLRAERELAHKEEQLEQAQFMAAMGSWELHAASGDLFCSKGLLNMLGLPLDAEPTFEDLQALVHPADLPELNDMAGRVAAAGGGQFDHSFRIVRPDGAVRVIQSQGRIVAAPDGSIERIVVVDRDVTEQAQAERLLTHQADILQMIARGDDLNAVLDAIARKIEEESDDALCTILLVDRAGERLHYGAAPSLPRFRERTDGVPITDGAGSCGTAASQGRPVLARDLDQDPRWRDYREDAAADGLRSSWSVPVFARESEEVIGTFALYRRDVGGPSSRDRDLVSFFTDLVSIAIERKRAEDIAHALELQYRHAQKMEAVGRLAGGVAHDFNNLLQAVLASARYLSDSLDEQDPRREDTDVILTAASRGADLVRQLLTFARREALAPRAIDLNSSITRSMGLLRAAVGEAIELTADLEPRPVHTVIDPGSLEHILLNLVRNAAHATEPGGKIWIKTIAEPSADEDGGIARVGLLVGDEGCGMDAATASRIFEPFFTTRSPGEGSGLGLASVLGSVEAAGGTIRVDTEPGEGTVFHILLPAGPVPEGTQGSTPDTAPGLRTGEGTTVLLAEDEEVVAGVLRKALERSGYRVLLAGDGTQALELAMSDHAPIDIVVTDVVMPGLSGPEVVRRLRASGRTVRALYMSGYSEEELDRRRLDDHGDSYLSKPFSPDDLIRAIQELVAERSATSP